MVTSNHLLYLQVTGSVTIATESITFYTDTACKSTAQVATFIGPATYTGGNGGHTTDQSLYYSCENMFVGGCNAELATIHSLQFSYTLTNGQTTTMPCMANERIANYSITPTSACSSGSPCGFSTAYATYTLFPAFAWVSGESTTNRNGVYGTKNTPSTANIPGARNVSMSWIDNSGQMWLFGGQGYATAVTSNGDLNDLWRYNPVTGFWTWISGTNLLNQLGIYGTKGVPNASNMPGGRIAASNWLDASGNFWLFGGKGFAATGSENNLNDLWKFNPTTKLWTWVSGSNVLNQDGTYGTKGTPSSTNIPGGRYRGIYWGRCNLNFDYKF